MVPLDNAIVTAFTPLAASFPGGLRADLAPEGIAQPYVVYRVLGAAGMETMYGQQKHSTVNVRFQVVGQGKTSTGNLMTTFMAAFDDATLTLSTGQNCDCRRLGEPVPMMFRDTSGAGEEIWTWTVEYVYSLRHS